MFPFLAIFIIFLVILTYYIKKHNAAQSKISEDFWEKERAANAVRKKDISQLHYITIPFEKIPQQLHTPEEDAFFALADKKILNLTGISNTDLKLTYGTANLTELSEYDENFTQMVSLIPPYAAQLIDAGQEDVALFLLEFGVSNQADSVKIFTQLASLYKTRGQQDRILWLKEQAALLPSITARAIEKELTAML